MSSVRIKSLRHLRAGRQVLMLRASILAITSVFCLFSTGIVQALPQGDLDRIYGNQAQYVPGVGTSCSADSITPLSTNSAGGTIYVLGDSITVGLRDTGDLPTKLNDSGWETTGVTAEVGRDLNWGVDQIKANAKDIAKSHSILIGLGTNNIGTVVSGDTVKDGGQQAVETLMQNVVTALKDPSVNPDIQIYWTSFYMRGTYNGNNTDKAMPILNAALNNVASSFNFTVLPWSTSAEAPVYLSSDGIHPSAHYPEMADYIVGQLSSPGSNQPTLAGGCTCGSGSGATSDGTRDGNYKAAWGFFTGVGRGLSPEATAGIMGNLEAESGINPQNTQNNAPVPDGPEIPIEQIRGSFGYGIAQWTSAGRQQGLIDYAKETNRSTGDIGLQLDYLWKELNEKFPGVLAELQAPGVTLDQAAFVVVSEFEVPKPFTNEGTQAERDATTAARQAGAQKIYDEFKGQNVPGSAGGGCNATGTSVDLVSADTTGTPCSNNTATEGPADGHRDGQTTKILLCTVGSGKANSQIAGSVAQLLTDSAAAGVTIGIGDSYRTMDQQTGTYLKWCNTDGIAPTPGPYPLAKYSDYAKCPGGAPPGYSNHEMGLAFDFTCNGSDIPMSYSGAKDNPCFQWLISNASKYGLYEFGKGQSRNKDGYEGWHWSVDGS